MSGSKLCVLAGPSEAWRPAIQISALHAAKRRRLHRLPAINTQIVTRRHESGFATGVGPESIDTGHHSFAIRTRTTPSNHGPSICAIQQSSVVVVEATQRGCLPLAQNLDLGVGTRPSSQQKHFPQCCQFAQHSCQSPNPNDMAARPRQHRSSTDQLQAAVASRQAAEEATAGWWQHAPTSRAPKTGTSWT